MATCLEMDPDRRYARVSYSPEPVLTLSVARHMALDATAYVKLLRWLVRRMVSVFTCNGGVGELAAQMCLLKAVDDLIKEELKKLCHIPATSVDFSAPSSVADAPASSCATSPPEPSPAPHNLHAPSQSGSASAAPTPGLGADGSLLPAAFGCLPNDDKLGCNLQELLCSLAVKDVFRVPKQADWMNDVSCALQFCTSVVLSSDW